MIQHNISAAPILTTDSASFFHNNQRITGIDLFSVIGVLAEGSMVSWKELSSCTSLERFLLLNIVSLLSFFSIDLYFDQEVVFFKKPYDWLLVDLLASSSVPAQRIAFSPICSSTNLWAKTITNNISWQKKYLDGFAPLLYICDYQVAGYGRKGQWLSPLGCSLTLSYSYFSSPQQSTTLQALSLVVTLVVQRSLKYLGVSGITVKWPNDIYAKGKKLGGVLVEKQRFRDENHYVIGIGLNVRSHQAASDDLHSISLEELDVYISRSCIVRQLSQELYLALESLLAHGFSFFYQEWVSNQISKNNCQIWFSPEDKVFAQYYAIQTDGGILVKIEDQKHILYPSDIYRYRFVD